jgi:hypothetical protein
MKGEGQGGEGEPSGLHTPSPKAALGSGEKRRGLFGMRLLSRVVYGMQQLLGRGLDAAGRRT